MTKENKFFDTKTKADEPKGATATESTSGEAAKGEKQAGGGGGLLGAIKGVGVAALKAVTAVLRGIVKGITKATNYLFGGKEGEKEEEPDKGKTGFVDFLKKLFGFGKEEKSNSNSVETSNASNISAQRQSGSQFSSEMMEKIEGFMKKVESFMSNSQGGQGRSQSSSASEKRGVEVEVGEVESEASNSKPKLAIAGEDEKEQQQNPLVSMLEKMVGMVAATKDPKLMDQCQGILDGVNKENPELKDVTKGLAEKLDTAQGEVEKESSEEKDPMEAAMREAGGVLNTLKNSESIRPASVMDEGNEDRGEAPATDLPRGVGGGGKGGSGR